MEDVRETRLTTEELEEALKKAGVIKPNEGLYRAWIEPGEFVVTTVE